MGKKEITDPIIEDPCEKEYLEIFIRDSDGNEWTPGGIIIDKKNYRTGSIGYSFSGKIKNPESRMKYQAIINIILIGSKSK